MLVTKYYKRIDLEILNHQDNYENLGLGNIGAIHKFVLLGISAGMIYLFGFLIPTKENIFTFVGKNTMSVYLLHGLIYKFLSLGTDWLDVVDSPLGLILYIIGIMGLVCILAKIPLTKYMDKLYDFLIKPIHKIRP